MDGYYDFTPAVYYQMGVPPQVAVARRSMPAAEPSWPPHEPAVYPPLRRPAHNLSPDFYAVHPTQSYPDPYTVDRDFAAGGYFGSSAAGRYDVDDPDFCPVGPRWPFGPRGPHGPWPPGSTAGPVVIERDLAMVGAARSRPSATVTTTSRELVDTDAFRADDVIAYPVKKEKTQLWREVSVQKVTTPSKHPNKKQPSSPAPRPHPPPPVAVPLMFGGGGYVYSEEDVAPYPAPGHGYPPALGRYPLPPVNGPHYMWR